MEEHIPLALYLKRRRHVDQHLPRVICDREDGWELVKLYVWVLTVAIGIQQHLPEVLRYLRRIRSSGWNLS